MPLTPNEFKSLLLNILTLPQAMLDSSKTFGFAIGRKLGQGDSLERLASGIDEKLDVLYGQNYDRKETETLGKKPSVPDYSELTPHNKPRM